MIRSLTKATTVDGAQLVALCWEPERDGPRPKRALTRIGRPRRRLTNMPGYFALILLQKMGFLAPYESTFHFMPRVLRIVKSKLKQRGCLAWSSVSTHAVDGASV